MPISKCYEGGVVVLNIQSVGEGSLPAIDARNNFVSYFENDGRQLIFCGDKSTVSTDDRCGTYNATLYCSEIGWDDGQDLSWEAPCPTMALCKSEQAWLVACWMSFTGSVQYREIVDHLNRHAAKLIDDISGDLKLYNAAMAAATTG